MAERKITNNTILLFLGVTADNLDTVVCLTSIKNDFTLDEVDASSFCGPDKSPGDISGTITAEGQHLLDPATGKISGHGLWGYFTGKTTLFYEIGPAVPVSGDIIQSGQIFISALGNSYALNAQSSFSITLSVKGVPVETVFIAVTGLSISPATVTLAVSATSQMVPTFTPTVPTNTGITYSSSNAAKATVSITGLITAIASGSATITATTDDGAFTDTTVVTVS